MKYHLNWVSEYAHNIRHNCATKLNLKVFLEAKVTIASRNTLKYSFYAKKTPNWPCHTVTLHICTFCELTYGWRDALQIRKMSKTQWFSCRRTILSNSQRFSHNEWHLSAKWQNNNTLLINLSNTTKINRKGDFICTMQFTFTKMQNNHCFNFS